MRVRIDLAYDGTEFRGWATQPGLRTVQESVELALATILRVPEVSITCAGRTDTGVHARGQVVHVDVDELPTPRSFEGPELDAQLSSLARRLNGLLAADIRVRAVTQAPAGFDARFSALWRRYVYRVVDGVEDPLTRNHVLAWREPLDVDAMNAAAAHLLGEHDFASFCKKREGATTIRTLLEIHWERVGHRAEATVRADAFCHHMVRSLVGCMIAVGEGRRTPEWAAEVLGRGERDSAVLMVPPHGLTLEEVGYPAPHEMAAQATRARVVRTL